MENQYKFKTTKEDFKSFKKSSKNKGELLFKVFVNETNRNVPYPVFLSKLNQWLSFFHRTEFKEGVERINNYLQQKFA